MQRPLLHLNWLLEQEWLQPASSLLSPQSLSGEGRGAGRGSGSARPAGGEGWQRHGKRAEGRDPTASGIGQGEQGTVGIGRRQDVGERAAPRRWRREPPPERPGWTESPRPSRPQHARQGRPEHKQRTEKMEHRNCIDQPCTWGGQGATPQREWSWGYGAPLYGAHPRGRGLEQPIGRCRCLEEPHHPHTGRGALVRQYRHTGNATPLPALPCAAPTPGTGHRAPGWLARGNHHRALLCCGHPAGAWKRAFASRCLCPRCSGELTMGTGMASSSPAPAAADPDPSGIPPKASRATALGELGGTIAPLPSRQHGGPGQRVRGALPVSAEAHGACGSGGGRFGGCVGPGWGSGAC